MHYLEMVHPNYYQKILKLLFLEKLVEYEQFLSISIHFAQILLENKKFKENCVEINSDAAPYVEQGRSVFCKHVISCGKNVQISADTPVLFKNKVIAIGRAILSSEMICDFDRGVAIKIRDSLKSRNEEIIS
jgi:conserved protein with predicted RNA binding PUA domain